MIKSAAVLLFMLSIGGVLSGARRDGDLLREERRGSRKCKNPTGNLWTSALKGCGQAVCKKKGSKAVWEVCPNPATKEDLQRVEDTLEDTLKKTEENVMASLKALEKKMENICDDQHYYYTTLDTTPAPQPTVISQETCQGDCCWQGPSRYIVKSLGPADGITGWGEKYDTVELCAQRCEDLPDCKAFHYYGPGDEAYKNCFLQKGGEVGPQLDDGRNRLAGVCGVRVNVFPDCYEDNVNYAGQDFAVFDNVDTPYDCDQRCQASESCVVWTWLKQSWSGPGFPPERCFLKNKIPEKSQLVGVVSALRSCTANE